MKQMILAIGLVALLLANSAFAQEKCEGKCPATTATSIASDDDKAATGQCPIEAAMDKLPAIAYKVGDQDACCANSAAAMAKKSGKPVHFVVVDKTFDNEQAAYTSLVEHTEKFVADFTTPAKCDVSGKVSIGGKSCDCPVKAEETTTLVKSAVEHVAMTYAVGKETCNCPVQAKEMASKSKDKVVYIVNGEKTECEMTARLNLARAKYKAAVEALVKMEQPTAKIN